MMTLKLTYSYYLVLLVQTMVIHCKFANNNDNDELLSVVVVFRHGDRNPEQSYPKDPYGNESCYPEGWGQLINRGIRRNFDLGQWLRERYNAFLPPRYNEEDIRVQSTDVDRTLMSAVSNLGGLYSGSELDLPITWQPVPIHTESVDNDIILMQKSCKAHKKLKKKIYKEVFSELDEANKNLYEYITDNTGSEITDIDGVQDIFDILYVQDQLNFTLPDWVNSSIFEDMRAIAIKKRVISCYTPELARLKSGPLFNEIIQNFQKQSNAAGKKFLIYSGHEATLGALLTTMGAFDNELIFYGNALIFELRKTGVINMFYKTESELKEVILENCNFDCNLKDFVEILENVVIDTTNWQIECDD